MRVNNLNFTLGHVDWDEFVTYMMLDLREKQAIRNEREVPVLVCPQLIETAHRNIIRRIIGQSNPTRFTTLSDEGNIVFWNAKMACTR